MGQVQFQVVRISPWVKRLIIINVGIWFLLQTLLENLILPEPYITEFFSFTPRFTVEYFFVWQPFTYMFLHSANVFHVLLNMISLWFWLRTRIPLGWSLLSNLLFGLRCGCCPHLLFRCGGHGACARRGACGLWDSGAGGLGCRVWDFTCLRNSIWRSSDLLFWDISNEGPLFYYDHWWD